MCKAFNDRTVRVIKGIFLLRYLLTTLNDLTAYFYPEHHARYCISDIRLYMDRSIINPHMDVKNINDEKTKAFFHEESRVYHSLTACCLCSGRRCRYVHVVTSTRMHVYNLIMGYIICLVTYIICLLISIYVSRICRSAYYMSFSSIRHKSVHLNHEN